MRDDLLMLVMECAREVAEQDAIDLPEDLSADTALFGERGIFDSLGLVSLVVALEAAIEDKYDVSVSLADQRAMSQSKSPFRSIGSLASYADNLLGDANWQPLKKAQ